MAGKSEFWELWDLYIRELKKKLKEKLGNSFMRDSFYMHGTLKESSTLVKKGADKITHEKTEEKPEAEKEAQENKSVLIKDKTKEQMLSVLDVSDYDAFKIENCDMSNVKEIKTDKEKDVKGFIEKTILPSSLDLTGVKEVAFKDCDFRAVQELKFKDGAIVNLTHAKNLPEVLDLSNCDVVNLFGADLSGVKDIKLKEGATVYFTRAQNLPQNLDVSKLKHVSMVNCDLSSLKKLEFAEGATVNLKGAQNLPPEIKFKSLEQLKQSGLELPADWKGSITVNGKPVKIKPKQQSSEKTNTKTSTPYRAEEDMFNKALNSKRFSDKQKEVLLEMAVAVEKERLAGSQQTGFAEMMVNKVAARDDFSEDDKRFILNVGIAAEKAENKLKAPQSQKKELSDAEWDKQFDEISAQMESHIKAEMAKEKAATKKIDPKSNEAFKESMKKNMAKMVQKKQTKSKTAPKNKNINMDQMMSDYMQQQMRA